MVLSAGSRAERVRPVCIAVCASALAAIVMTVKFATPAVAKTPGSTYCYHGVCHRVKTIAETQALVGVEETLSASLYDDCHRDRYNPCGLTSSGEKFHADRADNTASPVYPDGTILLVWSPYNERALIVRVNNAGPYWGNRKLDLSRAAAERLGFADKGVADVRVRVIKAPEPAEAKYVANRSYPPVPGDIGRYASLEQAQTGMAVALALQASSPSPLAPVTAANVFAEKDEGRLVVAEAPQALGRVRARVAVRAPSSRTASLDFGEFAHLSLIRPQRQVASLSLDRETNQSIWGEDVLEELAPAEDDAPRAHVAALPKADMPVRKPVQVALVAEDDKSVQKSKDAYVQLAALTEAEAKPESKREAHKAKSETRAPSSRSAKTHARSERRSRKARSATSRRRSQRQTRVAYVPRRPKRIVRERTAGQQMSLAIRAQSSSAM